MFTLNKEIDNALNSYSKAYYELKTIADQYPDLFPSSVISCGTIAEFYSMMYLRYIYPDGQARFGIGSQKGWDIQLTMPDRQSKLFQVRSTSAFAKSRKIARPSRGFDALLVLVLDADFYASHTYIFDGAEVVGRLLKGASLIVPDKAVMTRRGSAIFSEARDISQEMHEALSEQL